MASKLEQLFSPALEILNDLGAETFIFDGEEYRGNFSNASAQVQMTLATAGIEVERVCVCGLRQFTGTAYAYFAQHDEPLTFPTPDAVSGPGPTLGRKRLSWRGQDWRILRKESDGASVTLYLQRVK